jgi:glycosyltransferase involved in cell wall biosynthesis
VTVSKRIKTSRRDRAAPKRELPETAAYETIYESGRLEKARATVCITLYNYESFIGEALMSVYDQSLKEIGLVVLDDRSTDDGCARVESWMRAFANRFAGIRLARHQKNQGLALSRNGAVSMSASEAVMILDADNLLYPRCVERLADSLEDTKFGFAYSIIEQFGGDRSLLNCYPWDVEFLKKDNYVDAMAMIRKSVWTEVGGYRRMGVAGWEDYDFWCKCVEAGYEGLLVPEILARYRLHQSSMLRAETNTPDNAIRIRAEMGELHPWLELKDIAPPRRARNRRGRSPNALLLEQIRKSE